MPECLKYDQSQINKYILSREIRRSSSIVDRDQKVNYLAKTAIENQSGGLLFEAFQEQIKSMQQQIDSLTKKCENTMHLVQIMEKCQDEKRTDNHKNVKLEPEKKIEIEKEYKQMSRQFMQEFENKMEQKAEYMLRQELDKFSSFQRKVEIFMSQFSKDVALDLQRIEEEVDLNINQKKSVYNMLRQEVQYIKNEIINDVKSIIKQKKQNISTESNSNNQVYQSENCNSQNLSVSCHEISHNKQIDSTKLKTKTIKSPSPIRHLPNDCDKKFDNIQKLIQNQHKEIKNLIDKSLSPNKSSQNLSKNEKKSSNNLQIYSDFFNKQNDVLNKKSTIKKKKIISKDNDSNDPQSQNVKNLRPSSANRIKK